MPDPIIVDIIKQVYTLWIFTQHDKDATGILPAIELSSGSFKIQVIPHAHNASRLLARLRKGLPRGKDPEYSLFVQPSYSTVRRKSAYIFVGGPRDGKTKRLHLSEVCSLLKTKAGVTGYYEADSERDRSTLHWHIFKD